MSQETTDIKCPCCEKKTIARNHNGITKVFCRQCRKEVEIIIKKESLYEPNKVSR